MNILSIRRITNDRRHNAFTGACWFKGDLYVGYRQGDDHVCDQGRVIILRSRDKGITWDTVNILRGDADTRDAALYTDGKRLHAVAIVDRSPTEGLSGCSITEDGDHWTPFQLCQGADSFVLWRPAWYSGKHYCAGYHRSSPFGVHWFESNDGHHWKDIRVIHESEKERPNETYLEILPDGTATMLMRCEGGFVPKHPYLCRSRFPFDSWNMQKLEDIILTVPALWTVDGRVYISGRWHPQSYRNSGEQGSSAQTAIFRVVDNKTHFLCALPSGPKPDHSYMGVARWPDNSHRFSLSFYSNAIANEDPTIDQWIHPDIYLADVLFEAQFINEMLAGEFVETTAGIAGAELPDPDVAQPNYQSLRAAEGSNSIDLSETIAGRTGILYLVKDIEIGPCDRVNLHLGYDSPLKVWWNGQEVFQGATAGPAVADTTSLQINSTHGTNRLAIAINATAPTTQSLFARWEHAHEV